MDESILKPMEMIETYRLLAVERFDGLIDAPWRLR